MNIGIDVEETWLKELNDRIMHWEKEAETLMEKKIDSEECNEISAAFQREFNGLLSRKPVGVDDAKVQRGRASRIIPHLLPEDKKMENGHQLDAHAQDDEYGHRG